MELKQLWKLVVEELQTSMSPASFASWIKPLSIVDQSPLSEGKFLVTVGCPSSFHQRIVDQRYYGRLQAALNRLLEGSTEVEFAVVPATITNNNESDPPPLLSYGKEMGGVTDALHRHGMREDYSFETFAVSSTNEVAYAAAKAVSRRLGTAYNPLFLYGGVGVGKTHLMQAIAVESLKLKHDSVIIYSGGEQFTNEIIEAIRQKKTQQFRQRYRKPQALFIDDIQFIAGKTTVQEEFFHTFNALLQSGGQVVMTSDRPPSDIPLLEGRLRSRFEAGLIVDIGEPGFELRSAIVMIKARQRGLLLNPESAQLIAANIESARKIEGFLIRLISESQLKKQAVTESMIEVLLGSSGQTTLATPPPLRPVEIIRGVGNYFSIHTKQIKGFGRSQSLVTARHIAMYLLRVDYKLPLTEVAGLFSNRDHTTVMHAVNKITRQLRISESLRIDLGEIRSRLYR